MSAVSAFQSGGGISGNALNLQVTGSGTFTYDVQALMKNVSFKPSTQGTIDSIKWQTWYKAQGNTVATGYRALAMQGGSLFIANNTYFEPYNPSGWQYKNFNLSPANFTRLTGSGSSTLDISPGGADIFFGFLLSRGIFLSGTDNYAVSFFTVDVNYHPVLPVVTSSPMNLAIDSGGTASFSVAAIGTLPLSYQWYRDNMIIPNQTSSSITVGNGVQALPGTYSVVISNPAGSITNSAGVLTVNSSDVPLLSPLQFIGLGFGVTAIGATHSRRKKFNQSTTVLEQAS